MLRPGAEPAYAIAHRGYSAVAPENSLIAFEAARLAGVAAIELDIRDTADGVPVVWHDPSVDARTDGTGQVAELALSELQQLDTGARRGHAYAGTRIASWDETLDLLSGSKLDIVIDYKEGVVASTLEPVVKGGMSDQVIFASFDAAQVAEARELTPHIRRGLITTAMHDEPLEIAKSLDLTVYSVRVDQALRYPERVKVLRTEDVAVFVWTANEPGVWRAAIELGVDGIITDRAGEYVGFRAVVVGDQARVHRPEHRPSTGGPDLRVPTDDPDNPRSPATRRIAVRRTDGEA